MMERKKIEVLLRDCFLEDAEVIVPAPAWWDNALERLEEKKQYSRWSVYLPKTRLAWAILPLFLILIGGAVYGATTLVQELFQLIAGDVEVAGLAQELDVSQTISGVTVNLERGYADSNAVLLGYTVAGPVSVSYPWSVTLFTEDGQQIRGTGGLGTVPGSDMIMGSWPESTKAVILSGFDTSVITGSPKELHLRLEIILEENKATEPFVLNFTLPFHGGKTINVGKTVQVNGIPITLDHVVITPWATRGYLVFHPPYDDKADRPWTICSVQPPGGEEVPAGLESEEEAYSKATCVADLTGYYGEWTFTVKEIVIQPEMTGSEVTIVTSDPDDHIAGPWVFHFEVWENDP